jgi:hypothetical protein
MILLLINDTNTDSSYIYVPNSVPLFYIVRCGKICMYFELK